MLIKGKLLMKNVEKHGYSLLRCVWKRIHPFILLPLKIYLSSIFLSDNDLFFFSQTSETYFELEMLLTVIPLNFKASTFMLLFVNRFLFIVSPVQNYRWFNYQHFNSNSRQSRGRFLSRCNPLPVLRMKTEGPKILQVTTWASKQNQLVVSLADITNPISITPRSGCGKSEIHGE